MRCVATLMRDRKEGKPNMVEERPEKVSVALGERSYDILIGAGLIDRAGQEIAALLPECRVLVVTDDNVAPHHLDRLAQSLSSAGLGRHCLILPAGERSKSFEKLQQVVNVILDHRLERRDVVLALGGGVIGDLAGFAAGIARRGMNFIQVPTSLLAQVDSSVGGKTGINASHGKNLVGVFHQPRLVLADTGALDTLPAREMRAGYAEIVKYGLIDRPDFFAWLEANWQEVFGGEGAARRRAIAESCRAKAAIVARDERESGDRALLNLGHTFGHALEAATCYDPERLVHGEGVAIGMVLAHRFSAHLGLADPSDATRVEAHLGAVGLPVHPRQIPGPTPEPGELMRFMAQDKKVSRGSLNFVLTRGIGKSFLARNIAPADLLAFLEECLRK